ncbi:MAG TPA: MgtC/SapB family protein [Gemmatimonadaceae bacterium]
MSPTDLAPVFPHTDVALQIVLAVALGLLVGLEREWAQKEIGVRTFSVVALIGMLASLLDPALLVAALAGVLLLVVLLNVQSLIRDNSLELTTSSALVAVLLLGALVGHGQYFTAITSAVLMTMLLAWKAELAQFAGELRPEEIRGAVLLGLISVVILPLLPDRFVDPWQLINPRQAWVIVVVIAGIEFLNYVLLRVYGTRGLFWTALLGGFVNSTAAVAELVSLVKEERTPGGGEALRVRLVALVLVANAATFVRNLLILLLFASAAAIVALPALLAMIVIAAALAWRRLRRGNGVAESLSLSSPISVAHVLRFALLFLVLNVAGAMAQRALGGVGFVVVGVLGGVVSSAGTAASAAALAAAGQISAQTAAVAVVLASIVSALVKLPIVYRQARGTEIPKRVSLVTAGIVVVGVGALLAGSLLTR